MEYACRPEATRNTPAALAAGVPLGTSVPAGSAARQRERTDAGAEADAGSAQDWSSPASPAIISTPRISADRQRTWRIVDALLSGHIRHLPDVAGVVLTAADVAEHARGDAPRRSQRAVLPRNARRSTSSRRCERPRPGHLPPHPGRRLPAPPAGRRSGAGRDAAPHRSGARRSAPALRGRLELGDRRGVVAGRPARNRPCNSQGAAPVKGRRGAGRGTPRTT